MMFVGLCVCASVHLCVRVVVEIDAKAAHLLPPFFCLLSYFLYFLFAFALACGFTYWIWDFALMQHRDLFGVSLSISAEQRRNVYN